ncbi:MAG TPA: HD-GYP domain-containing protein [Humisphaera sp.]|jgi:HD-GYP domain-containing protein (c-di-GMP phosphodiesterase class II)|nr:HD-GYP domain-containing protein [Humisphaera sp.]
MSINSRNAGSIDELRRTNGSDVAPRAALEQFSHQLAQAYEEVHLLFRFARLLNSVDVPEQLIQIFCNQLFPVLPFSWLAVRFHPKGTSVRELSQRLFLSGQPPCSTAEFEEHSRELVNRLPVGKGPQVLRPQDDPFARRTGADLVAVPVTHAGRLIAGIIAGNKCGPDLELSSGETQLLDAAAGLLGVFHENVARLSEQRSFFFGTVSALTAAIDAKDRYTCGHSERVALLAAKAAEAMKLPRDLIEQYHIAGLVHDVGKIGIAEAVLTNPGRLTADEFAQIKRHPEIGYGILKDIPHMTTALPGVLHHHERWDGKGYPHGLAGEAIPLIGRVLALADTFDAMTSTRSYRAATPREKVLEEIRRCAGTQFDPALVPMFVNLDFADFEQSLLRHKDSTMSPA